MSKTLKCSECGNKKWKRKDKDNFICVKCKQKEKQKERKAEKDGRMTREEAISNLRNIMGKIPFGKSFDAYFDACSVAIQSLEAWDEIINHLEATAKELLKLEDENGSHAFAKGIIFSVSMIELHMKEVEE